MKCALIFTLLAVVASTSLAAPMDLNNLFLGLPRNSLAVVEPQPDQDVVKRQVLANPDGQLKQVSFQALIGNLENSLFQSALSVSGAANPGAEVAEVKPEAAESNQHSITKRADEPTTASTPIAASEDAQERKILVQTTKKVPVSEESGPAHLIIDRVSVQPHSGISVPLIPTFQVHHTKITTATIKEDANKDSSDGKQTKISITKTSITSTAPVESVETQSSTSTTSSGTTSSGIVSSTTELPHSSSTSTSTTASSSTTSTTTEQAIVKQKQVEEEKLKAKVAEVEAEPVILTARV